MKRSRLRPVSVARLAGAPVEPVSTLNYSKDLTVEPVPDWEDLYGRAAKLANEYETMARNSHDWMVDALAAANRDRDYLLAETLRLTKENNQAAPVPAPPLEWVDWGRSFESLDVAGEEMPWSLHLGREGTLGENTWTLMCGGTILRMCPDIDYLKSLAEKLNAVLSPPVGTQP